MKTCVYVFYLNKALVTTMTSRLGLLGGAQLTHVHSRGAWGRICCHTSQVQPSPWQIVNDCNECMICHHLSKEVALRAVKLTKDACCDHATQTQSRRRSCGLMMEVSINGEAGGEL